MMKSIALGALGCLIAIPAMFFQSLIPPVLAAAVLLIVAVVLTGAARKLKDDLRLLVFAREGILEVGAMSTNTTPWTGIADLRVTKLGARMYLVVQKASDSEKIDVGEYDITATDLQGMVQKCWPVGHEALPTAAELLPARRP